MNQRRLIECTIDISKPYAELTEVIGAVLAAIPNADDRVSLIQSLSDVITTTLFALEDEVDALKEAETGPTKDAA
jgi:hypothetical protein